MIEQERDNQLRTFNTAKEFSSKILFPLMFDFKKFQRQSNYGHENLDNSIELSEEIREIQRFNGLKASVETVHDLLYAISSTVKLKGNKEENKKLNELIELSDKIKLLFYQNKDLFFRSTYKDNKSIDLLDRDYFEKVKDIIDTIYVNTEILMTKNKLLFDDSKDEYLDDKDIMESIRKEFIGE
jgi:hypothetical protein